MSQSANLVSEKTSHDDIIVPREHASDIPSLLALPQLDVLRSQVDGMASQLIEPSLKGDSGAHGRLGEDHGHGHALERLVAPVPGLEPGLHLRSLVQDVQQRLLVEVVKMEEMCRSHFLLI